MAIMNRAIFTYATFAVFLQLYTLTASETTVSEQTSSDNGDTVIPDANGDTVIPDANGDTVIPDANGDTVIPDANGDTVIPDANGDTQSPDGANSPTGEGKEFPKFCGPTFRVDAFAQGGDGFMYAFRRRTVFKIGPSGLEAGYPKKIKDEFPGGLKRGVGGATFDTQNKKLYLFTRDMQVWRFSKPTETAAQFQLDEGYPKPVTGTPKHTPYAVFTLNFEKDSLFVIARGERKNVFYYMWDINSDKTEMANGPPGQIKDSIRQAPKRPNSAFMNTKGETLFFKRDKYILLDEAGKEVKKASLAPDLFGAVCGGTATIHKLGDY